MVAGFERSLRGATADAVDQGAEKGGGRVSQASWCCLLLGLLLGELVKTWLTLLYLVVPCYDCNCRTDGMIGMYRPRGYLTLRSQDHVGTNVV